MKKIKKFKEYKKCLTENTVNEAINTDLELKSIGKKIYYWLSKNNVGVMFTQPDVKGSQSLKKGESKKVWLWVSDGKLNMQLVGPEESVKDIEARILKSFPNIEQKERKSEDLTGGFMGGTAEDYKRKIGVNVTFYFQLKTK